MPGKNCGKGGNRKHTPIVSRAQQKLFGAVASGKKTVATGLTKTKAVEHLKESKGKNLPARAKLRRRLKKIKR
ncbi:MAG: hypothetical protein MUO78_02725 [candidate division Zixibacteria bacterium]|nr:hypothetical protein [candidate division Zixibacteria bacterium]